MSTAVNIAFQSNTTTEDLNHKKNSYHYGKDQTDSLSIEKENLEIKPRSLIRDEGLVNGIDNIIEIIKQKWNGTVVDFNYKELTARLEDLTNPDNPDEIVTFSIEEIESRDQPLIQKGAMFFWQMGYRYGPKYPRERFSKIRFRRLAKWTADEIKDANSQAKEYADFFLSDSTHSA